MQVPVADRSPRVEPRHAQAISPRKPGLLKVELEVSLGDRPVALPHHRQRQLPRRPLQRLN
ncbi:MAG: hypothetical protein ACK53L_07840 [Pirellulaceae bacterium]